MGANFVFCLTTSSLIAAKYLEHVALASLTSISSSKFSRSSLQKTFLSSVTGSSSTRITRRRTMCSGPSLCANATATVFESQAALTSNVEIAARQPTAMYSSCMMSNSSKITALESMPLTPSSVELRSTNATMAAWIWSMGAVLSIIATSFGTAPSLMVSSTFDWSLLINTASCIAARALTLFGGKAHGCAGMSSDWFSPSEPSKDRRSTNFWMSMVAKASSTEFAFLRSTPESTEALAAVLVVFPLRRISDFRARSLGRSSRAARSPMAFLSSPQHLKKYWPMFATHGLLSAGSGHPRNATSTRGTLRAVHTRGGARPAAAAIVPLSR
mmetsp:Transcript_23054/g.64461  ORF Transcript_23054/g.64461 Transcript_23054/m.64461 type:complete len:329 (-) Transcript_23054:16-1002(-)